MTVRLVDFPWTDAGNAERLVALHGEGLRYCAAWGRWLRFDGRRWLFDDGAPYRAAKETARAMLRESADVADDRTRQAFASFATKSESRRGIEAMVALARHEEAVAVTPDQLDADPWAFNVQNGTLDLHTGELRPHRRADLITKCVPISFDPKATCPTWLAFLVRVLADDTATIEFLWKAVGYSLTADVREQLLFFLVGRGRNGKSTLLRMLLALIGDYARQAAPDLLLSKNTETHPTEQADLFGCRLAVCTEIEQGRAFAEATVKQLTGGDKIKARRMREDFWEFPPTHKLWIAANHKPTIKGTDLAIWRRIRLVPFDVTIPENEVDPQLPAKLEAELPGILNWAVQGCQAWQRDGLKAPQTVTDATDAYKAEQDQVGAFIAERCMTDERVRTAAADLYRAYEAWCDANGERALGAKNFGLRLQERGLRPDKGTAGKRMWKGIAVVTVASGASGTTSRISSYESELSCKPETCATTRHSTEEVQ